MSFGSDFTDNPASPGSGGESIATFLLGIPDGGSITSLPTTSSITGGYMRSMLSTTSK